MSGGGRTVSRVDDLAPDEQALLRLILQQGRSYADLARLLKTSPDVVRERAHLGLQHVVGCDDLDDRERAAVADYVLGQQDQAGQERARDILRSSPAANHWALMLVLATAAVVARPRAIPSLADEPLPATPERVRPNRSRPAIPRSSRTGGAILLGVCAVLVVVTVKIVTGGHDQQPAGTASASAGAAATASPSATATPSYQAVGQVQLSPPGGGRREARWRSTRHRAPRSWRSRSRERAWRRTASTRRTASGCRAGAHRTFSGSRPR